jgi:hypothetical protein
MTTLRTTEPASREALSPHRWTPLQLRIFWRRTHRNRTSTPCGSVGITTDVKLRGPERSEGHVSFND